MFTTRIPLFISGALLLVGCSPVAAQTTGSARPFHGALFGNHHTDNAEPRLNFSLMLLEAYDDNLAATVGTPVSPGTRQVGGYFSMLQPGIDYRWQRPRVQIGITGASALGYYPQVQSVKSISHTAGAGMGVQVGPRASIFVNQTAAYSPSYLYGLFPTSGAVAPGDPLPDAPNYAVSDVESYSYGTTGRLSYGLSRRTTASVSGEYRYTDFVHESLVQRDQISHGIDGELSHQGSRNVTMRLSYHYLTGNLGFNGTASTAEHGLQGGASYSRPLSATRKATFGFDFGGSAVHTLGGQTSALLPDRIYRASGDASFDYQFSSWQARSTYRRGLEFVPGIAQPVFTNAISTSVDGLLTHRVEFGLGGGYSQGASAISSSASQFNTYNASARLQYAITSSTAIHFEYLYYFYDFLGDVQLTSGAPPRLRRNGVRFGLRMLIPALKG